MNLRPAIGCLAAISMMLAPGAALAQNINVTRSILLEQPYTLIYPDTMVASGGADEPVTINHPDAPLQCDLSIVPVEDTSWTAGSALSSLVDEDVTAGWSETFPGFTLGTKTTTAYQSNTALLYDGTSTDSPMGMPLTLVHTETVDRGRGYALDCIFATDAAAQARPIVDFIIANFSTRSDAECCVGLAVEENSAVPAAATQ
jgi:hypothetical protein